MASITHNAIEEWVHLYGDDLFKWAMYKTNDRESAEDLVQETFLADVSGELTIHGVTQSIMEKGTIVVKEGKVTTQTKMKITLPDYNIAFENGKPSTNIAKTIDVTVNTVYGDGN